MGFMDFINGLRNYAKPIIPNFRPTIVTPASTIVPVSCYAGSKPWSGIVVHHSEAEDGPGDNWSAIRKYHMSYRVDGRIVDEATFNNMKMMGQGKKFEPAWRDIAYHAGQEYDNGVVVFRMGRSWSMVGAHAGVVSEGKAYNFYNENYLGYCIVGDWDKATPPLNAWEFALKAIREIMGRFNIVRENVIGHREVYGKIGIPKQKSCPGEKFSMELFRASL
jgi:hypothetical protein